jgi:hypothetical protein
MKTVGPSNVGEAGPACLTRAAQCPVPRVGPGVAGNLSRPVRKKTTLLGIGEGTSSYRVLTARFTWRHGLGRYFISSSEWDPSTNIESPWLVSASAVAWARTGIAAARTAGNVGKRRAHAREHWWIHAVWPAAAFTVVHPDSDDDHVPAALRLIQEFHWHGPAALAAAQTCAFQVGIKIDGVAVDGCLRAGDGPLSGAADFHLRHQRITAFGRGDAHVDLAVGRGGAAHPKH